MSSAVPNEPPPPYSGLDHTPKPYDQSPNALPYPVVDPGYPGPPPPQQQTTVIAQPGVSGQSTFIIQQGQPTATVVVQRVSFGHSPIVTQCPHCSFTVTTVVRHEAGVLAYLLCGFMLLFGCWLGCCLIPFCIEGLQDVYHECPRCHRTIGHAQRI